MKLDSVRRMYGSHLAMRLASERIQLSRPHRLPGMPSNNLGMDICLGLNERVEFSDYLNGMSRVYCIAPNFRLMNSITHNRPPRSPRCAKNYIA